MLKEVKDSTDAMAINKCREELVELTLKEEIMWKQCAKTAWLKEGDRNTRLFHGIASRRKRNNGIFAVKDDDIWHEKTDEDERVFLEYFHNIFTSSNPSNVEMILQAMTSKVTVEMNVSG